ncbi:MAG: hypothetical protein HRT90_00070 [Candidatus Margulisbacteria bacterium]|nr:hypothetical protein [Candidatus Margulisiibacteriota bacterium]
MKRGFIYQFKIILFICVICASMNTDSVALGFEDLNEKAFFAKTLNPNLSCVINGSYVDMSYFESLIVNHHEWLGKKNMDLTAEEKLQAAAIARETVLFDLVKYVVLIQFATYMDRSVDIEEVNDIYDAMALKSALTPAQIKKVKKNIHVAILKEKLISIYQEDVKIWDQQVNRYYYNHKKWIDKGIKKKVLEMAFDKKEEANMVMNRLRNGEDFSNLAYLHSTNIFHELQQGKEGYVDLFHFPESIASNIFRMKMTDPPKMFNKGNNNYHIVKVVGEKEEGSDIDITKKVIRNYLVYERGKDRFQKQYEELLKDTKIILNAHYFPVQEQYLPVIRDVDSPIRFVSNSIFS